MKEHFINAIIAVASIAWGIALFWHILKAFLWLYRQAFIWAGDDLQSLLVVGIALCLAVLVIAFWPDHTEHQKGAGGSHHGKNNLSHTRGQ